MFINFVVLESYQVSRQPVLWFLSFFTIYERGGHLGHVSRTKYIKTFFHVLPEGCIRNLIEIGLVVSEEKFFENIDRRRTTTDAVGNIL